MRLGGPLLAEVRSPEEWVTLVRRWGYRAAYAPVSPEASSEEIAAYREAAERADIVIAEVGVWNNPLSRHAGERKAALDACVRALSLADELGARCCVNIGGSLGEKWDGPCADDLGEEAFDLIVETVRSIIDEVKPLRTFYTLETMPWMYPHTAESYERLIKAVDRKAFAVHFDPVNMIWSPERFFHNGEVIRDFVRRLGPWIRSCHLKDVRLQDRFLVHLEEVIPGRGNLDYRTLLSELDRLDDVPGMLEHLSTSEEYVQARDYVTQVAQEIGVGL